MSQLLSSLQNNLSSLCMCCTHQKPRQDVVCSQSKLHDSTGPLSYYPSHHPSIMLETAQPTAQTDAQSLIQVRGRLI
jgi:hypothetical protein